MSLPSVTLSLLTERLPGVEELELDGWDGAFVTLPPKLEKFHLPAAVLSSVICGSFSVISVTCNSFDVISGHISTPTFNDFAVTKGDVPKAESSAIAMLSAVTDPVSRERPRLPTVTLRPRASLAVDSIFGRKLFTLMRKGIAIRITINTATTIPIILRVRFMAYTCLSKRAIGLDRKDREESASFSPEKCIKNEGSLPLAPVLFGVRDGFALELFLPLVASGAA